MRVLISFLFIFVSLYSKDLSVTYKVSFGIFGKIGTAKASLHVKDKKYKIKVVAKSSGFAAFISGDREEVYESEGFVEDGLLIPLEYRKTVQNSIMIGDELSLKKYIKIYKFNHEKRKIIAFKTKIRGKSISKSKESVPFYAKNDLLSLFFNFRKMFPDLKIRKHHILHAVGADKKTGKIDIFPLKKEEFDKLISPNSKKLSFMRIILSDKIFSSKKGELYLALDSDGICKKAVLKDVLLFGDIRGVAVEKNDK